MEIADHKQLLPLGLLVVSSAAIALAQQTHTV